MPSSVRHGLSCAPRVPTPRRRTLRVPGQVAEYSDHRPNLEPAIHGSTYFVLVMFVVVLAFLAAWMAMVVVHGQPVCEICGCSYCPPGFTAGDPDAVIPIPAEFAAQVPPGLTQIKCSFLEFLGASGQIPAEFCDDTLRLAAAFRSLCACPALPAAPSETSPVAEGTGAPAAPSLSESPVAAAVPSTTTPNDDAGPVTTGPVAASTTTAPTARPVFVAAPAAKPSTSVPEVPPPNADNLPSPPVMAPVVVPPTVAPVPQRLPSYAPVTIRAETPPVPVVGGTSRSSRTATRCQSWVDLVVWWWVGAGAFLWWSA